MSRSNSPVPKARATSPLAPVRRMKVKSATKRGKNGEPVVAGDKTLVDHVQAAEKVLYDLRWVLLLHYGLNK